MQIAAKDEVTNIDKTLTANTCDAYGIRLISLLRAKSNATGPSAACFKFKKNK